MQCTVAYFCAISVVSLSGHAIKQWPMVGYCTCNATGQPHAGFLSEATENRIPEPYVGARYSKTDKVQNHERMASTIIPNDSISILGPRVAPLVCDR